MVGNGGTSGTIGTGNIILTNSGTIVINHSDAVNIPAAVRDDTANGNGTGSFVQYGTGTTTLTASNTFIGSTTVSNGTLVTIGGAGDMNVRGGTLAAGGLGTVGTLNVGGNMNISAGKVLVTFNKSLSQTTNSTPGQTNTIINVAAAPATYTGGTLVVTNVGPALVVGDKFAIFSLPVNGGGAMPIVSPNYTFANNLAVDGSITVTSVTVVQPPAPTLKPITVSGNNLIITATNNAGNNGSTYTLLATNNLTAPISTWPVVSTGTFDANGGLVITNAIGTNHLFYILRVP
jgi:autotransporter-associated beta strand protein